MHSWIKVHVFHNRAFALLTAGRMPAIAHWTMDVIRQDGGGQSNSRGQLQQQVPPAPSRFLVNLPPSTNLMEEGQLVTKRGGRYVRKEGQGQGQG